MSGTQNGLPPAGGLREDPAAETAGSREEQARSVREAPAAQAEEGQPQKQKSGLREKLFSEGNVMRLIRLVLLALITASGVVVSIAAFGGSRWLEQGQGQGRSIAFASVTVGISAALIFSMAMKVFVSKRFSSKIGWYVVDVLLLMALTVFSEEYAYLSYAIVLSEFYLSAPALRDDMIMFGVCLGLYTIIYVVVAAILRTLTNAFQASSEYFVALVVFVLHFIIFNFAMVVWRKNRQIEENLREIEQSRNELLHAYDKLEEATVIEERNRIAKDIHDTAGHSLTTVIMQTEAARLALDKDPQKAKQCITAANLQAKNCLEQLRSSVHLLSGKRENVTFKEYLETILEESAVGTELHMRSIIDDIELTDEAERFIANSLHECLANGIRHGGGTAFLFEFRDAGNFVEFFFSDNGKGVNMKEFKEGFGLSGMRAKAESMGGMVNFSSEEGEGFEIRLSLPRSVKRDQKRSESV